MTILSADSAELNASEAGPMSCEALGLLVWRLDGKGQIRQKPSLDAPVDRWLQSDEIANVVTACARRWLDGADPVPYEHFDGCAFAPISRVQREGRTELTIAVIIEPAALESEAFAALCRTHGIEVGAARGALRPHVLTRDAYVRQLSDLLERAAADRESAEQSQFAANDLAKQLADAYEQISFLYRLSREMTALDSPRQFVESICRQLHYLLTFGWVAIKYVPSKLALKDLDGELILDGDLPCPAPMFNELAGQLIESWAGDDWTRILDPGKSALAAMVGSEILVEEVTYDDRIIGALMAGNKSGHDPDVNSVEAQLMDAAACILGAFHQNVTRYEELRSLFVGTVQALTATVDAKDPYTRGHSDRVAHLGRELARAAGLDEEQIERVFLAGIVHDVGKIGVPEAVLRKPGRLTDGEFQFIKQHPIIGFNILHDVPQMEDLLPGVLHHHERWDGRGYPHGLAGEEIPLFGRILGLPDAFDAMSSNRAYRPAMPREKVLDEIRKCAGAQFDPILAKIFVTLDFSKYDEMVAHHRAQEAYAA